MLVGAIASALIINNVLNKDQDERYAIYKLAVESGYDGTYESWLESISGREIILQVNDNKIEWKYNRLWK